MWIGENGEYRVPDAIVWLAEAADHRAGINERPPVARRLSGPGFKVFAEWGCWRDSQEAVSRNGP